MTVVPLIITASFAGFTALALAMPRHWRQIRAGVPPARPFRILGVVVLLLALLLSCLAWGAARGVPLAIGLAMPAAMAVAFVLALAPQWLVKVAIALPAIGLLVSLVS